MAVSNPNGSNQYKLDPRQELAVSYYIDPKSDTFGNLLRSVVKAGYSESYGLSMYGKASWLPEKARDMLLIELAENNLKEFLTMDTKQKQVRGDEVVEIVDPQLTKIKQDTSKFISERLNKQKYSIRQELTGKDGKDLPPPQITVLTSEAKKNIEQLYEGSDSSNK